MTDLTLTAPSVGVSPSKPPQTIEPISLPCWGTPLSTAHKGYQGHRLQVIESAIWPYGIPHGLHVSERNRILAKQFEANGWDPPSVRHLQRLHGGR